MNVVSPSTALTLADLERILTGVDPSVLLVPSRILRRVIKKDRGLEGIGLQVPHRKSYVIPSADLLNIADRAELRMTPDRYLPETLILLLAPYEQDLKARPPEEVLRDYWRLLFHARIHKALQDRIRAGWLDEAALRERIRAIGLTEFAEIESVLRQENFLLPPTDAHTIYEEFASLYLELKFFQPHLLPRYFPTIANLETVDQVLAQDVAAEDLWHKTRPAGAADPAGVEDVQDEQRWWYRHLIARAEQAASKGNVARSAIFRQRAVLWASSSLQPRVEADALADIDRLAARLQLALHLEDAEAEMWRQSLSALLEPAAQGVWPVESRLLYDLQKVCLDQERELYAVDLVEWVASLGRKPIQRPLTNQKPILRVRHLRRALHRLTAARLSEAHREQLNHLLTHAIHQGEKDLRDTLRPRIAEALAQVGLKPGPLVEELERDKLVEELLDVTVEKGFLTMSDLRDAVAPIGSSWPTWPCPTS